MTTNHHQQETTGTDKAPDAATQEDRECARQCTSLVLEHEEAGWEKCAEVIAKHRLAATAALRKELDALRADRDRVDFMLALANGAVKVDFGVQADETMTRAHLDAARKPAAP